MREKVSGGANVGPGTDLWIAEWNPINVLQPREEKQLVRRSLRLIRDAHQIREGIKAAREPKL